MLVDQLAQGDPGEFPLAYDRFPLPMIDNFPAFRPNPCVGEFFSKLFRQTLATPQVGSVQRLKTKRIVWWKHGLPKRLRQTKLEGKRKLSTPYCSERIRTR